MVHYMALVFDNQGQYDKALNYCERVWAGREKSLGVGHPDTLTTVNNMAFLFNSQGQYDKALKYYERAFLGNLCSRLGSIVLYLSPVLNPKSYDGKLGSNHLPKTPIKS